MYIVYTYLLFWLVSKLEMNSICYKENAIMVLAAAEDDDPEFAELKHIVAVDEDHL